MTRSFARPPRIKTENPTPNPRPPPPPPPPLRTCRLLMAAAAYGTQILTQSKCLRSNSMPKSRSAPNVYFTHDRARVVCAPSPPSDYVKFLEFGVNFKVFPNVVEWEILLFFSLTQDVLRIIRFLREGHSIGRKFLRLHLRVVRAACFALCVEDKLWMERASKQVLWFCG